MRRLLFAIALIAAGGMIFAAGTPARALPANALGEISKAMPASNIDQARCWWRHGRRYCHRYYRRYYYYRPYYYRRHYHRRHCYRHRRHWHCYWR